MDSSNRSSTYVEVAALEHILGSNPAPVRTPRTSAHLRCECEVCGAHTYARPDQLGEERCGNCLSTGLSPIEEVASPPTRWGVRDCEEPRVTASERQRVRLA